MDSASGSSVFRKFGKLARAISPFTARPKEGKVVKSFDQYNWELLDVDVGSVLRRFYQKYNPEKIDAIDAILDQYEGEEGTRLYWRHAVSCTHKLIVYVLVFKEVLLRELCGRYKLSESDMQGFIDSPIVAAKVPRKSRVVTTSRDVTQFHWDLEDVDLSRALKMFYQRYNPEKVSSVDEILQGYRGDESKYCSITFCTFL
jgi:hypothetical protein